MNTFTIVGFQKPYMEWEKSEITQHLLYGPIYGEVQSQVELKG